MQAALVFTGTKWPDEALAQLPPGVQIASITEDLSQFDLLIYADFSPYLIPNDQCKAQAWHLVNCFYASFHNWEQLNSDLANLAGVKLHLAFANGPFWELVCTDQKKQETITQLLEPLHLQPRFVENGPCTTSARLVAMIINEAFLTLHEQVASEVDIDLAMKLGTGYPFGPFEWANRIGKAEVLRMLVALQAFHQNSRYQPAPLLGSTNS